MSKEITPLNVVLLFVLLFGFFNRDTHEPWKESYTVTYLGRAADSCVRGRIDVSPHHTYVKVDQKQKNLSSP